MSNFPLDLFICYCSQSSCCPSLNERRKEKILRNSFAARNSAIKLVYLNVFCCIGKLSVEGAWSEWDYGTYKFERFLSLGRFVYCRTIWVVEKGHHETTWKRLVSNNTTYCSTVVRKNFLRGGGKVFEEGKWRRRILFLSHRFFSCIFISTKKRCEWKKVNNKKNLYQIFE